MSFYVFFCPRLQRLLLHVDQMDWQIKKKAFTQYDFDYLQKKNLQREERSVFGDVVMALTSLNEIQRERELSLIHI